MDEIFGVSMTTITQVLVALLAVALIMVAIVAIRRPVVFKLGARNIPRRKAQTVLIVVGLMLSTLIVASALGLGDTFAFSLTRGSYDASGHVDQIAITSTKPEPDDFAQLDELSPRQVDEVIPILKSSDKVDGILPVLRVQAPALNDAKQLGEPVVNLVGIDPAQMAGFEDDVRTKSGDRIEMSAIQPGEIVANEALAEELDIVAGDNITVYYGEKPHQLRVAAIARSTLLTGRSDASGELDAGAVMPLAQLRDLIGDQNAITVVAVSLEGGVRSNLDIADDVRDLIAPQLRSINVGLINFKKDQVDFFNLIANVFTSLFLVLGLFSIGVGIL